MTGTNFSSWYNQSEGSIFTSAKSIATNITTTRRFLEISDGTATQRYFLGYSTTSNTRFGVVNVISGVVDILTTANPSAGVKMAVSYATNNFASATNGTLSGRDLQASIPSNSNNLKICDGIGNNIILNGTISRLTYYPIALTQNQMVNLTS
jgi:hypothetical protein